MADELTADEIRALLKLEPNATCGFVQMTYLSTQSIAAGGLPPPFADARPMGSALYFMVTPAAPVRLHRIRNDQLYHYYLGDRSRSCCCMATARPSASLSAPTCAGASAFSC
jgi:predicted cupin superfamily sugar epimerase